MADDAAPYVVERDGYIISTERGRLDLDAMYHFLSTSYWSAGISRGMFERTVAGALPFGLYDPSGAQVGYARTVTDYALFAWLSDVYVLSEHRGRGLGQWLVASVMAHPRLQGMRRWMLATSDAHALYAKFGFIPIDATRFMARVDPEAHKRSPLPASPLPPGGG